MSASKNPLARMVHIRDEIDALAGALDGVDYTSFSNTYVLRRTAEHALLIISEAVKALGSDFTDHHRGIEWRAIRDIGNVLRHEYFEIDTRVIWRIITERLPQLHHVVEEMIAEETRSQG